MGEDGVDPRGATHGRDFFADRRRGAARQPGEQAIHLGVAQLDQLADRLVDLGLVERLELPTLDRRRVAHVEPIGRTGAQQPASARTIRDRIQFAQTAAQSSVRGRRFEYARLTARPLLGHALERGDQRVDADARATHGCDHRKSKRGFEILRLDPNAGLMRQIDHVERNDDRQPQLEHLQREIEIAREVARIEHQQHRIRPRAGFTPGDTARTRPSASVRARSAVPGLVAGQRPKRDGLVFGERREAVRARQIHQRDERARMPAAQPTFARLDRDPGIVADLVSRPREQVEQAGLADIRIAGDSDSQRTHAPDLHAPRLGSTQRHVIPTQAKLERITKRCTLDQRDLDSGHEAHLEQAHRHRPVAAHRPHSRALSDRELIERFALPVLKTHFNTFDSI